MSIIQPVLTVSQAQKNRTQKYWWQENNHPCSSPDPQPGQICPTCNHGQLDYDSLFLLVCNHCGVVAEGGAFT
jgi:ribosomal protein L37AE/L43A